jgi:glycine/D-amino acid oxidase-like deaminating enzyme
MLLSRRDLLQGAAAFAGQVLSSAIAKESDVDVRPLRGGEILPPPDFSLLRSRDPYLIGIRPHRQGGVRLELESEPVASRSGAKFLIHNYGHGGAGITLSFGCAEIAADHVATVIRELRRTRIRPRVAVIGSGVIGLTVASAVRRRWPRLPITVYAKDLDVRKTTSFKSGGQFQPSGIYEEYEGEQERKVLADYVRRSRARIVELGDLGRWNHYGIALRRNYTLDHPIHGFDDYTPPDVVPKPNVGLLPFPQLNVIGREYRTWLINPIILLPRLVRDLKRGGVAFRQKLFADRSALAELKENIIVNCTGYGAKALFGDDLLIAQRGHLVVLKRTRARQFYFFSGGCTNYRTMYVFCRHSDIVVGGTVQEGNESEALGPKDARVFHRILENASNLFAGHPSQCGW